MLFDGGEKAAEVGEKQGEVEGISHIGRERAAGFHITRACCDAGAKRFLKRRDVLVEIEELRGEVVLRGEPFGPADSRVVLGRTSLCGGHLRGADDWRTISSYQPG